MRRSIWVASLFCAFGVARADAPVDARRAAVCLHVGDRAITVGEVEDRMAQVPPFQLRTFGATEAEIRRAFLEQVIIPDALWAQGAAARHVDKHVPTRFDFDRTRAQATLRAMRARLGTPASVSMDDVQAYYDKNKARYDAPERYQIWRISCATREEAHGDRGREKGRDHPALEQARARSQRRQGDVPPRRQRRVRRARRNVERSGIENRSGDPESRSSGA